MAYDIFSPCDTIIIPNSSINVWTDVCVKLADNQGLIINVRSSFGKHKVMLANTQGWVDADYYDNEANGGNIGVMLYNFGKTPFVIKQGDRIAQAMIVRYDTFGDVVDTERNGGFGSTGR